MSLMGCWTNKNPLDGADAGDVRVVGPTARISPNIPGENPLVSDSLSPLDHFDDAIIPGLVPMIHLEVLRRTPLSSNTAQCIDQRPFLQITIDPLKDSLGLVSGLRIDPYLPE